MPKLLSEIEIREIFGIFSYRERNDGTVSVDKQWVKRCITAVSLPALGKVSCHRRIAEQLCRVFAQLNKDGLSCLIDVNDTLKRGGCFFPRHMNWDCHAPLSRHTWGIAIDINPSQNRYGTAGTLSNRIIEIFNENGFLWGGQWNLPDPMHFEIFRLE